MRDGKIKQADGGTGLVSNGTKQVDEGPVLYTTYLSPSDPMTTMTTMHLKTHWPNFELIETYFGY